MKEGKKLGVNGSASSFCVYLAGREQARRASPHHHNQNGYYMV